MNSKTQTELNHRLSLWKEIQPLFDKNNTLSAGELRRRSIYGGATGIYVDKSHTKEFADEGATVSVMYTGLSYEDEVTEVYIVYQNPSIIALALL